MLYHHNGASFAVSMTVTKDTKWPNDTCKLKYINHLKKVTKKTKLLPECNSLTIDLPLELFQLWPKTPNDPMIPGIEIHQLLEQSDWKN